MNEDPAQLPPKLSTSVLCSTGTFNIEPTTFIIGLPYLFIGDNQRRQ